jgi:hypothetical protein
MRFPLGEVHGTTCAEAAVSASSGAGQLCLASQRKYRSCCDGTVLSVRRPVGPVAPVVVYKGPHPLCHLCISGEYPRRTSMVINVLYIGAGSCKQYYMAGREGKIVPKLCDPLRYFAQDPCGCAPTSTRGVADDDVVEVTQNQSSTFLLVLTCVVALHIGLVCICFIKTRYDLHIVGLLVNSLQSRLALHVAAQTTQAEERTGG